jgi:hypothetical protein
MVLAIPTVILVVQEVKILVASAVAVAELGLQDKMPLLCEVVTVEMA